MNLDAVKFSTIFAVDDDPMNLDALSNYLTGYGFTVVPVGSGMELLTMIDSHTPDIILLDIIMPEIDGFETCRQLKANAAVRDIPVIFMSALCEPIDKVRGFSAGAVDYIAKPIEGEELLSRIHTHLTIYNLQNELRTMNVQLEEKIRERTQELTQANEALKQEIEWRESVEKELREREDQLTASLKEKSVLLEEVHHRVKNNMQLVSSLLSLQAGFVEDEKYKKYFTSSQNRIFTMALIHEKLYHSKNLSQIDFDNYIRALTDKLLLSFFMQIEIEMNISVNNMLVNLDIAIPCALMITELVSNSLEYAFEKGQKGEITIEFYNNNNRYTLIVADNGKGLPSGMDFRNTNSLGLSLVNELTTQLKGKVSLDDSSGVKFIIEFDPGKAKTSNQLMAS
ncbi:MAG: response regulator [bacterium]|nr:response regulator [bacterium]